MHRSGQRLGLQTVGLGIPHATGMQIYKIELNVPINLRSPLQNHKNGASVFLPCRLCGIGNQGPFLPITLGLQPTGLNARTKQSVANRLCSACAERQICRVVAYVVRVALHLHAQFRTGAQVFGKSFHNGLCITKACCQSRRCKACQITSGN